MSYNKVTALLAAGASVAAMLLASPESNADPAGCQTDLWGFLGSQRRTVCDGPKRANGEWTRGRVVWTPAHQVPFRCTYGTYYSSCSGGYFVPESYQEQDRYPVTDDTVVPGEPGWLGNSGRLA